MNYPEIVAALAEKRAIRSTLTKEIKALEARIDQAEREYRIEETKKRVAAREATLKGAWKLLAKTQISEKGIIALQNQHMRQKDLGPLLGVTPSRAQQILAQAYRKLRHPAYQQILVNLKAEGFIPLWRS